MKSLLIGLCFLLLFVLVSHSVRVSAQQASATPLPPTPVPLIDLERQVYQLQANQDAVVKEMQSRLQNDQTLIQVVGLFALALTIAQGAFTIVQFRREGKRENDTRANEKRASDQMFEVMGVFKRTLDNRLSDEQDTHVWNKRAVDSVSGILEVVQTTLQSRLTAEQNARAEAAKARKELAKVLHQVKTLEAFYATFLSTITHAWQAIEKDALKIASTPRHEFKKLGEELKEFTGQFKSFSSRYSAFDANAKEFSPRTYYVLGIAAHYANQPEDARRYLSQVVTYQQPEQDEDRLAYQKRISNSYYFLGLIQSNFGKNQDALNAFEEANRLDLQGSDFLTRVVTAEAYVMSGKWDEANNLLDEVRQKLAEKERAEGHLAYYFRRLRSRATLILANILIISRSDEWRQKAIHLLDPITTEDAESYYATSTLAQLRFGTDGSEAGRLFAEAYKAIEASGDLLRGTEIRSQILLLMVASMCCKYAKDIQDETKSTKYLDEANRLCESLPKLENQACTVYSPLSKRNEAIESIRQHIDLIRKETVLF